MTYFYQAVRDNIWVARAFAGIRAVVAPVILSAVLKLQKSESPASRTVFFALCLAGCVLSFVFRINSILIVLVGVALGVVYHVHKRGAAS